MKRFAAIASERVDRTIPSKVPTFLKMISKDITLNLEVKYACLDIENVCNESLYSWGFAVDSIDVGYLHE